MSILRKYIVFRCFLPVIIFTSILPVKASEDGNNIDFGVFESSSQNSKTGNMISDYIYQNNVSGRNTGKELDSLKSPDDWKMEQDRIRDRFEVSNGRLPEKRAEKPEAEIIKTTEFKEFKVMNVILKSREGLYITCNIYIPLSIKYPVPGIIFCPGHAAEGKGYENYFNTGIGLAQKGYAVMLIDPIGQGERKEYTGCDKHVRENDPVGQHNAIGRPLFLLGKTLLNYYLWDYLIAVDYFAALSEVDKDKLGYSGCSGGGRQCITQAGFDKRIKILAPVHPGGCMGDSLSLDGYLKYCESALNLVAPRPCNIIIGKPSGEKFEWKLNRMRPAFIGMNLVSDDYLRGTWVEGYHGMDKPKREAVYEWFNSYFSKENCGREEGPLTEIASSILQCTKNGNVVKDIREAKSIYDLNNEELKNILPSLPAIKNPDEENSALNRLKAKINTGILFKEKKILDDVSEPSLIKTVSTGKFTISKYSVQTEPGIIVPVVVCMPSEIKYRRAVVIIDEISKKRYEKKDSLALKLLDEGFPVVLADLRDTGDTDRDNLYALDDKNISFAMRYMGWQPKFAESDFRSLNMLKTGSTMTAGRCLDIVRILKSLKKMESFRAFEFVLLGNGAGGFWSILASAYSKDISSVILLNTLFSLQSLIKNKIYNYYKTRSYFWIPGALKHFDIGDIAALSAPRPVLCLNPIDQNGNVIESPLDDGVAGVERWKWSENVYKINKNESGIIIKSVQENDVCRNIITFLKTETENKK